MKHPPKPDSTRWMMRNGQVSGPLKETGYPEREYPLTDGRHRWTLDGHFNASRSQHSFDLLYPVTVTPLPDPEPEEPKPPKEVWVNWYTSEGMAYGNETAADAAAATYRLTGDAIRYVLPDEAEEWKLSAQTYKQYCQFLEEQIAARARSDEAERGFSEEEIEVGSRAYLFSLDPDALSDGDLDFQLARRRKHIAAALSAISQHRSKKP